MSNDIILQTLKAEYINNSQKYDLTECKSYYKEFKDNYSTDVLSALQGKGLLQKLFSHSNGLLGFLGHKTIVLGVMKTELNMMGLYFSKEENCWIKGNSSKESTKINEDEAIIYAEQFRDKLIMLVKEIKNMNCQDADFYRLLDKKLLSKFDGAFFRYWFIKYLHFEYPFVFSNFYHPHLIGKVLEFLGVNRDGGIASQNGQLSNIAKDLLIPNPVFYSIVLNKLENIRIKNGELEILYKEDKKTIEIKKFVNKTRKHSFNTIVYGAPGTGKTYNMPEYALSIIKNEDFSFEEKSLEERAEIISEYNNLVSDGRIVFTTFHQNYTYEDFIQGVTADTYSSNLKFVKKDGIFKMIATAALSNPDQNYVIIIDEINRANISKVFGELISLIEEDKRWGEINQLSVTLPSGDIFMVPNNLYILGTMNSADKSISLIDVALRRRFSFVEQIVNPELIKDLDLRKCLINLNIKLKSELNSSDLLVGHSYFMKKTVEDLEKIMNTNVIPMLYEYFYDDEKKIKIVIEEAIKDLDGFSVVVPNYGRIKLVKDDI